MEPMTIIKCIKPFDKDSLKWDSLRAWSPTADPMQYDEEQQSYTGDFNHWSCNIGIESYWWKWDKSWKGNDISV